MIEKQILQKFLEKTEYIQTALEKQVTYKYFQYPDTRKMFELIEYHYNSHHEVLNRDTFQSYIRQATKLTPEELSRQSVLFEEVILLTNSSNFDVLLEEFRNYYATNSLKSTLDTTLDKLADKEPSKAIDFLKTKVTTLERDLIVQRPDSGFFGDKIDKIIERYNDKKIHPEKYKGLEFGWKTFDRDSNGVLPGCVAVITGSMKSAKSVLLINIAYYNLLQGKNIYYHVNEGGASLVEDRLSCRGTGLMMDRIMRCQLDPAEYIKYEGWLQQYKSNNQLYVDPVLRSLSTVPYIERRMLDAEQQRGMKFDMVIIDHLGLMSPGQRGDYSSYEKYDEISMELKEFALKHKLPVITVMHVTREGMKSQKKNFEMHEMGLSLGPAKNLDTIISWRVDDEEELKTTRRGHGSLSIQGARESGGKETNLQIDTNIMKIWEVELDTSNFV